MHEDHSFQIFKLGKANIRIVARMHTLFTSYSNAYLRLLDHRGVICAVTDPECGESWVKVMTKFYD